MSHVITRSKTRQLNLQAILNKDKRNNKRKNKRKISDQDDLFRLQSGKPIKRNKIVELGKPSDYYKNLD